MEELIERTIADFHNTQHEPGQYNVYSCKHRCYIINADYVNKPKYKKLVKGMELVNSFYYEG